MVLQNLRDICKAIIKELILNYEQDEEFNKWSHETIIKAINFIKSKRTPEGTILQALIDYNYLISDDVCYSLGSRVKNINNAWVVL